MSEKTAVQRPRFQRAAEPPSMRFQERDLAILQTIQDFDGVMTRRHIKELFWPQSSQQAMEVRLSKLYHNAYLDWPNEDQRRTQPIPEPIVWLGWRGILAVAGRMGVSCPPPKKDNENQLRVLQTRLRKEGIRWAREPNWNQPRHEIAVADFRLALLISLEEIPHLELEEWIPESVFRAKPDVIRFSYPGRNGGLRRRSKGVIPDGYFVLRDLELEQAGKPHRAPFLLEMDLSTHDNPSFGIEKVAVGSAYVKSKKYKQRFETDAGRWLVVTTGETRLQNLMRQTKRITKSSDSLFFFTTLKNIASTNLVQDDIWLRINTNKPVDLLRSSDV